MTPTLLGGDEREGCPPVFGALAGEEGSPAVFGTLAGDESKVEDVDDDSSEVDLVIQHASADEPRCWICEKWNYGEENAQSHQRCNNCGTEKKWWLCDQCDESNKSSRQHCNNCGAAKADSTITIIQLAQPDDI
jgi:hypothetical protein